MFGGGYGYIYYQRRIFQNKVVAVEIDGDVRHDDETCKKSLYNYSNNLEEGGMMLFGEEAYDYEADFSDNICEVKSDEENEPQVPYEWTRESASLPVSRDDGLSVKDDPLSTASYISAVVDNGKLVNVLLRPKTAPSNGRMLTHDCGANVMSNTVVGVVERPRTAGQQPERIPRLTKELVRSKSRLEVAGMGSNRKKTRQQQLDDILNLTVTTIAKISFNNVSDVAESPRHGSKLTSPITTGHKMDGLPSFRLSTPSAQLLTTPQLSDPSITDSSIKSPRLPSRSLVTLSRAVLVVKPFMWLLPGVQYIITSTIANWKITISSRVTYTAKQFADSGLFNQLYVRLVANSRRSSRDWGEAGNTLTETEKEAFMTISHLSETWEEALQRRAVVTAEEAMRLLELPSSESFFELSKSNPSSRLSKSMEVTRLLVPFPLELLADAEEMTSAATGSVPAVKPTSGRRIWDAEDGWENIHMLSHDSPDRSGNEFEPREASGPEGGTAEAQYAAAHAVNLTITSETPKTKLARTRYVYVVNAFLPSMREVFAAEAAAVTVLILEWDSRQLPWRVFMSDVVGHRDPLRCNELSIRGAVRNDWRALGLEKAPSLHDNTVHASSSAFEGMLDRVSVGRAGGVLSGDPMYILLTATIERPYVLQLWISNCIIDAEYNPEEVDVERIGVRYIAEKVSTTVKTPLRKRRSLEWFDRCDSNECVHIAKLIVSKTSVSKPAASNYANIAVVVDDVTVLCT
jgi:hypothetical protein